tara:strand:+ start:601 stop:1167 length:567 start_codon:yes stop_codon:yes gene_type:complete
MSCIVSRISFTDIPWETIVNLIAPHLTMKEYGSLSIQNKYLRDLFTSNEVWEEIYIKLSKKEHLQRCILSVRYEEMLVNPYLLPCQREQLKKMYDRRVKKESTQNDKIQYRRETLLIFLNKKELNYRKLEDKNEDYKKQLTEEHIEKLDGSDIRSHIKFYEELLEENERKIFDSSVHIRHLYDAVKTK